MAYPRPSIGPWQIAEIDIHLLNEIFRQIEEHVGLLEGLSQARVGNIAWHTHETDATGGQISHDRALTDVSDDDHHPKIHHHDGSDGSGTTDHGNLTGLGDDDHLQYILGSRADWTDLTDGGDTILHTHSSGGSSSTSTTTTDIDGDATTQPWEVILIDANIQITELAGGHAIKLRAMEPVATGWADDPQLVFYGGDILLY